jgi:hypothetical protein
MAARDSRHLMLLILGQLLSQGMKSQAMQDGHLSQATRRAADRMLMGRLASTCTPSAVRAHRLLPFQGAASRSTLVSTTASMHQAHSNLSTDWTPSTVV